MPDGGIVSPPDPAVAPAQSTTNESTVRSRRQRVILPAALAGAVLGACAIMVSPITPRP
jgi:hypothetical protein